MEKDYGDITVDSQGRVWTVKAGVGSDTYVNATGGDHNASTGEVIEYTSGSNVVRLPTAVGNTGKKIVVKNSGSGVITIDGSTTETIDGYTTVGVNPTISLTVMSNGANWIII